MVEMVHKSGVIMAVRGVVHFGFSVKVGSLSQPAGALTHKLIFFLFILNVESHFKFTMNILFFKEHFLFIENWHKNDKKIYKMFKRRMGDRSMLNKTAELV